VHDRTGTPIVATIITAATAGFFALFVDLEALADLVSVGALSAFFLVSLACLWRRFVPHGELPHWSAPVKIAGMVAASIGLSAMYTSRGPAWLTLAFFGALHFRCACNSTSLHWRAVRTSACSHCRWHQRSSASYVLSGPTSHNIAGRCPGTLTTTNLPSSLWVHVGSTYTQVHVIPDALER
jgi:amino acid transporter